MKAARIASFARSGPSRNATELLRDAGVNCTHVGEIGMAAAADSAILERALTLDAVIVTLDADFHAMLAVDGKTRPSVVRIRVQGY